jgi:hypothetical protein
VALALTSRRRAVAAAASAVAAVALALGVVGKSCAVSDRGPEDAVRAMLAAASAGDRRAVFELLSPDTQRDLTARAQRATDLVGSSVRYSPLDLISISTSPDIAPPTDLTVVMRHGDHAVVEVVSPGGRERVDVVRVDDRWRIDMPQYRQRAD